MAKFMKSFIGQIGGITSRVTGGEFFGESETLREDASSPGEDGGEGYSRESSARAKSPLDSSSKSLSSEEDRDSSHWAGGEEDGECPVMKGTLSKWTNYLHGWQERYVVVAEGIMSYYKSSYDTQYGCRGSISLNQVRVLLHEFDELRFDIRVHDCTYFFRASSVEEKSQWMETVEENKRFSPTMRRQGSILSLSAISQASNSSFKVGHDFQTKLAEVETYRDILCRQVDTLQAYFDFLSENNTSTTRINGLHKHTDIDTRLPEEDNNDDISQESKTETDPPKITSSPSSPFIRSSENTHLHPHPHTPTPSPLTQRSLQTKGHRRTGSDPFSFTKRPGHQHSNYYAHAKTAIASSFSTSGTVDLKNIDFRGEAITFKATTAGILASLSHLIDMMNKREDYWQKKCEKEVEKRRKADLAAHAALNGPRVMAYKYAGPDFEEGPHSALNEEEFFDALEITYQNEEMERLPATSSFGVGEGVLPTVLETVTDQSSTSPEDSSTEETGQAKVALEDIQHKSITGETHRLTQLVDEKVSQYAKYIFEPVDTNWSVVYEDGDLKVYRRELEEGGVVVDPLKSFHVANSVSARELTNFFFDFDTRMEWEGTIESAKITEKLSDDTIIFHHMHKRVWPSTQRETVFCSHICTLPNAPRAENQVGHTWMVCNFSVEHDKVPTNSKLIRATFQVGFVCQTVAKQPVEKGKEAELTRNDIACKILYATNVNPGGWAPPAVVRTIGKREITKFLRKFSGTVQKRTVSSPLSL